MTDALADPQRLLSSLTAILLYPNSNPPAAFLIYGIIGLALLIVLVIVVMFLMGSSDQDEEEEAGPVPDDQPEAGAAPEEGLAGLEAGEVFEGVEPEARASGASRDTRPAKAKVAVPPLRPRTRIAVSVLLALVFVVAWTIAGYTTSDAPSCTGCHGPTSEHAKAVAGTDPHAKVPCVSCHETGGTLGRYVTDVPARLLHFAESQFGAPVRGEYGRVTVAACSSCHANSLRGVVTDSTRGLRISHEEPLAASATCLDCHALRGGVVGSHNTGMAPCLRCHDAKQAAARCATCHDQRTASAARARTFAYAKVQIPEVSCGGCHDQKKECDWCHGLRLPHSAEFKGYAHARAGVVDFWFNGGRTCARCHTAKRRPCQRCHTSLLGKAHGRDSDLAVRHRTSSVTSCNTCHAQYAYVGPRDFCKDVCHTPAAVANSPR